MGASVGDSGAWLIGRDGWEDLTEGQVRKPLLGSGVAEAVGFASAFGGTLLVATDGLLKYAAASRLVSLARNGELETVAAELVDAGAASQWGRCTMTWDFALVRGLAKVLEDGVAGCNRGVGERSEGEER